MDRREFLTAGVGGALSAPSPLIMRQHSPMPSQDPIRDAFPRLRSETFLNAAAGTPLGTFAERGLQRYTEFQRLGPGEGRAEYVRDMLFNIRGLYGRLVGARESEIALVHCTKAGEQIILDGLLRQGRNVVTNDLHFSGSLHNLVGLRRAGHDVRIVRAREWDVGVDEMAAAIDDNTALVAVTLVSNINGRVEPMRELADYAHSRGAFVYADIIQATGVMPLDLLTLGVDFAASNAYKWLFGVHGAGFLYVREELQGAALPDRLFPGHVEFNYAPWVLVPDPERDALGYQPPSDGARYQPGHVSYLAYSAVYEGLRFIERVGLEALLAHSVRLNRRLLDALDRDTYEVISPHADRSPILTFLAPDPPALRRRLEAAKVVVTLAGNRVRVSPAIFNTEDDIDRLTEVLNVG